MHKLPTSRRLAHALALTTSAALATLAMPAQALNPNSTSVQMFQWSWPDIATECTQWLGPKGFGGVQISPPHASKVANGWWGVYQPVNYVNLTSRMGTPAQLQSMINACHAAGVRVYADIVVNQMADGSGTATDGSTWNGSTLSYPYFSASDFHPNCTINDADYNSPAGRSNVQNCRLGGLPDLATDQRFVPSSNLIANAAEATALVGEAIAAAGTPAQKALLEPIIAGQTLAALAHEEADSHYAPTHVTTRATQEADGSWRLQGHKAVVVQAEAADVLLVSARTSGASDDADGISLFLIPANTAGLQLQGSDTIDGAMRKET